MEPLAEYAGGLPNLCLQEPLISEAITAGREYPVFPHDADTQRAASTFAVALHMHQPILAGGDLHARAGHQQPGVDDGPSGHRRQPQCAGMRWYYKRMGEFIRQLPGEGRQPRVMLDYSGTLLHGMRQMGLDHVFDALGYLTGDLRARQAVEWLGCTWGHAVAPSTPPRTCGCTCAPGSTILLPSSALRRSGASADSPPPRWRCPTTPMSPARSSAPWLTAAISGCWSRSTPRSSPTAAASAAPAGVHKLARQHRQHHRGDQDPRQRHQAGGPDAAPLRGHKPASRGAGGPANSPRGHADR